MFADSTPPESRTDAQVAAVALSAELTDELVDASAMIFAVPLYNFGVSQHFKAYVDLVIADPRMAAGAEPMFAGTPAVLVTVRGGAYGAGTPREGWDHATGWMRRILADVWRLDLEVVEAEFALVGVNPALDQFKEMAAALRREAEEHARLSGRKLGASTQSDLSQLVLQHDPKDPRHEPAPRRSRPDATSHRSCGSRSCSRSPSR